MVLKVLYEDNHLIAVYKPAGVLVQEDETGDVCLMDEVKEYLKEKYNKSGDAFLGMIHRLDRPVSGIVLFAKTSKGASRLAEQFRNHTIIKIYHALVLGKMPQAKGTLVHYLIKDREKNVVSAYEEEVFDSLRAELDYEVVKEGRGTTLLKINLKTGRPHQIRVQLSTFGHPIVGDVKYGLPDEAQKAVLGVHAIALCATSLEFKLATKDEIVKLEIEVPKEWSNFK